MKRSQLALAWSTLLLTAPVALAQGSFAEFGPALPGGFVAFTDVTADGTTVSGFETNASGGRGLLWTAAAGLTDVFAGPPYEATEAMALSADGNALVGRMYDVVADETRGFSLDLVQGGGLTVVRDGSTPALFDEVNVVACNGDGTFLGGNSSSFHYSRQAAVWDLSVSPVPILLPYVGGDTFGTVFDFADSSSTAVGTSFGSAQSVSNAFRWSPSTGTTRLAPPAGWSYAGATAISRDGSAVFGFAGIAGGVEAALVRWNSQGLSEVLGRIPASASTLHVEAASGDGSVAVGSYSDSAAGGQRGFYWAEGTGLMDLEVFLESRISPLGLGTSDVLVPGGLSSDGDVIVGRIRASFGPGRGFIATLFPSPPMPVGTDYCGPPVANSIGETPSLDAWGSVNVAHNDLVLRVDGLPGRSFGILMASQSQGSLPAFGGGVGTQCLGSMYSLLNQGESVRLAGIFGRASVRLDLGAVPFNTGPVAIQPGDTWNFQFWYRDQGSSGVTTNLTSARTVTFQ